MRLFLENFDQKIIIGELQTIRNLNGWDEDQVGGLEIFLEGQPSQALTRSIENVLELDLKLIPSDDKYLEIF